MAASDEDLRFHTHVSHKWLHHMDACAGSVLTPHDSITNVQKKFGKRVHAGFGQYRLCGSWTLNLPAALLTLPEHTTLGGLKLADPMITTKPRGLTEAQSRPADLLTAAAVWGRSVPLDVSLASSNKAAARGMQRKLVWTSDGQQTWGRFPPKPLLP